MNLFEINEALDKCFAEIEEAGGEIGPLQESMIESLELAKDEKIKAIVAIIRREEDRVESCEREIKRIQKLSASSFNKANWLRDYLASCIGEGIKYDGDTFKLSWRRSEKVEVIDEKEIPEIYIKTKVEKSVDKISIKNDLKVGCEIPGVCLVSKNNLQIK